MDDPLLAMAQQVQGGGSTPASSPAAAPGAARPSDSSVNADGSANIVVTGPSRDPLLDMAQQVQDSKEPAKATDTPVQQPQGATWAGGEIGRQLGLTARAAGHGIADTVDLVGAPLNATINTLFGAHLHNPGDTIRSGVDAVTPAPKNALERVVNAGAGAMAGAATGAGVAGKVASAATNPLTQAIAAQMAAAPAAQIAAGAGAGTASQGAQEAGAGPVAQMGAGLLGGVAGGVAGAGVAAGANKLAGVLSAAKPVAPAARVEPSMGGQPGAGFQDASRPQSTMYTGADGTTSTTPPGGQSAPPKGAGFMGAGGPAPAAAGGRGSVGAAGTSFADQARAEGVPDHLVQRIAEGEKAGTLNPTAAERHIEAGSLPVPVDLTAGQATGDINLLSHEQNIRGKVPELADRFNAQNGQIAANFDAIRDKVAPDVHAPAGQALDQAIVDAYKAHDAPIQEDIASKYKALEAANGGQFPLNGTDFVNSATSALNAQSKAYSHFLPSKVSNMLSDFKDSGSMNFNDFESMRTILANEARKASAAGDGNAAHAINIVRNSLESLPMTNETAALKPLADAARAAAKARFDAMGADPAYAAAVNDGVASGSPSPAADGFFRKYVVQGKSANVQNMLNTLSSDPTNAQLLAAGMIDHVKAQSGLDLRTGAGNVSQAGLNKALTNLKDKPGIVLGPEASQTLERLGNVARYTQEQPRGSYVNNSNTFVAGAANATKSALEGAANVAAHGVPVGTWARQALAKRAIGKEAAQSLEPGAGLNKLHSAMGGRR